MRRVMLVAVMASLVLPLAVRAQTEGERAVSIPPEVLLLVEIGNPAVFDAGWQQFSMAVEPMQEVEQVTPFLWQEAGGATPDMTRPFQLVCVKGNESPLAAVSVFSLEDASGYLEALGEMWEESGTQGDVHVFIEEGMDFNMQVVPGYPGEEDFDFGPDDEMEWGPEDEEEFEFEFQPEAVPEGESGLSPEVGASPFMDALADVDEGDEAFTFIEEGESYPGEDTELMEERELEAMDEMDMDEFFTPVDITHAVAVERNLVCMGDEAGAVAKVLELVRAGQITAEPMLSSSGKLVVFAKTKELAGPIGEFFDLVLGEMGRSGMPLGPTGGADPMAQMNMQKELMLDVMQQLDYAYACVEVDAERMQMLMRAYPAADSAVARYIQSVPQGLPETLQYAQQDAVLAVAGKAGDLKPFMEKMKEFQQAAGSAAGVEQEALTMLEEVTGRAMAHPVLEQMLSVRSAAPWEAVAVYRYATREDAEAVLQTALSMPDAMSEYWMSAGVPMMMEARPDVEEYMGHKISEFTLAPDTSAGAAAGPMQMQQMMFVGMFLGEGLKCYATVKDQDYINVMGKEGALDSLKAIIDGSSQKLADSPTFHQAMERLPAGAQAVGYLRLPESAGLLMSTFAPFLMGTEMTFEPGPGIIGGFGVNGDRASFVLIVPSAEIRSTIQGVQNSMMGQMMAPPEELMEDDDEMPMMPMPMP